MVKIYVFYANGQWGYVERREDVPDYSSQSFEAVIDDLSADEKEFFCGDCLIYDGDNQTVSFDHEKFDTEIRNKLFTDLSTAEGKYVDWLSRRTAAYPSIGDQLDMIYHDAVDGTNTWLERIAAAKVSTMASSNEDLTPFNDAIASGEAV
tara:strand:- start:1555 stop:2004 length:450 start_codon:yes stop_codon:yes gene_type:complete